MRRLQAIVFGVWLLSFVLGWLVLVSYAGQWQTVRENWGVALAMVLGSYVAGSTPMGGGTVGFPAMVLLFDFPSAVGRDFALAIQSAGMTSAALFIFLSRRPVHGVVLRYGLLGTVASTPVTALVLSPHVSDTSIKMVFAVMCAGFGLYQLSSYHRPPDARDDAPGGAPTAAARRTGLVIGLCGGAISALVGIGVDIVAYAGVVLVLRCDVRRAVYTSIVLMAATSMIGTATYAATGDLATEAVHGWLAAAPVVVFGAAFGTVVAGLVPRRVTMTIAAVLCLVQIVWMGYSVGLDVREFALAGIAAVTCSAGLHAIGAWARGGRPESGVGLAARHGEDGVVPIPAPDPRDDSRPRADLRGPG